MPTEKKISYINTSIIVVIVIFIIFAMMYLIFFDNNTVDIEELTKHINKGEVPF